MAECVRKNSLAGNVTSVVCVQRILLYGHLFDSLMLFILGTNTACRFQSLCHYES